MQNILTVIVYRDLSDHWIDAELDSGGLKDEKDL